MYKINMKCSLYRQNIQNIYKYINIYIMINDLYDNRIIVLNKNTNIL